MKNRWFTYVRLRLFLLLLLTVTIAAGWIAVAHAETPSQSINASGGVNVQPAVDPIDKGEGFSVVLCDSSNGLPTSEANAIAQTGDGFIWVGTYNGLIRYDGNTFERLNYASDITNVRCLYAQSKTLGEISLALDVQEPTVKRYLYKELQAEAAAAAEAARRAEEVRRMESGDHGDGLAALVPNGALARRAPFCVTRSLPAVRTGFRPNPSSRAAP